MENKLLPCPFCGGEADLTKDIDGGWEVKDNITESKAQNNKRITENEIRNILKNYVYHDKYGGGKLEQAVREITDYLNQKEPTDD